MAQALPTWEELDELFTTDGLDLFARKNGRAYSRKLGGRSEVKVDGKRFLITRIIWHLVHREDPGNRRIVPIDEAKGWHVDNLKLVAQGRPKNPENAHLPERITRTKDGKYQVTGVVLKYLQGIRKPAIFPGFETLEEAIYKADFLKAWAEYQDRIIEESPAGPWALQRAFEDPDVPSWEDMDLVDGVLILRNPEDWPLVDKYGRKPGGSPRAAIERRLPIDKLPPI